MQKTFTNMVPDNGIEFTVDNIEYKVTIQSYNSICGYAPVMIEDTSTGERFMSHGHIELNHHIITTRWKAHYDNYRENWISSHDLVVNID